MKDEQFAAHLSVLESAGLVDLVQHEPELAYLFRHVLIQDAAYQSLLKAQRKTLHRRVAAELERLYPEQLDSLALVLGRHYRQADEYEPARRYLTRAGEVAQKQYANREAIGAYGEALECAEDDEQRFDLLLRRAAVYDIVAERDRQRADVDALIELAERLDDEPRRCDALIALTDYYLTTDYVHSRETAEHAVALARRLKDPVREGRALWRAGESAWSLNDYPACHAALEEATTRFREAGLPAETAKCFNRLAVLLSQLGRSAAAQQAAHEAERLSRIAGDRRQAALALRSQAIVYMDQARFAEALPVAEATLALCRELGDQGGECHALNTLGNVYAGLDQLEEARAHYGRTLALAQAIGAQLIGLYATINLAELYSRQGRYEEELAFLKDQEDQARRARDDYLATMMQSRQSRTLNELGQFARALELRRAGLAAREKWLGRKDQVSELAFIGLLQAALAQFEQARATLATALQVAAETCKSAAEPLVALAHVAEIEGRPEALRPALVQAQQALASLAATTEKVTPGRANDALLVWFLAVVARLHLALGEPGEALECSARALRLQESQEPWAPAALLFTHSRALRACGRAAEAGVYLQEAYDRVQLVARNTRDETLRRDYLEMADNRAILAAAAAGGSSARAINMT